MKKFRLPLLFLFISTFSYAQKSSIPKILIGASVAHLSIGGDVKGNSTYFLNNSSYGIEGEYVFSKYFGAGIKYQHGSSYGLNTGYSFCNGQIDNHWTKAGYKLNDTIYDNYKLSSNTISLFGDLSTNKTKRSQFGLQVGIGALFFNTKVNALDAANKKYEFGYYKKTTLDNTYETPGEKEDKFVFDFSTKLYYSYAINNKFYISPFAITSFTNSDLLDAQHWQGFANNVIPIKTKQKDNLFLYGISFFYKFKSKEDDY